jgi:hypothetical protein
VPDNCWLSTRSSCRTRAFPTTDPCGAPNLSPLVAERWANDLGSSVSVVDFVYYALAVLSATSYRARYDEPLRRDYPRIPPPREVNTFRAVTDAGRAVAQALLALDTDAQSDDGPEVHVGHVTVRSHTLVAAVRAADDVVSPLIS